ncbi:MAG TPA: class I SAM-dependent methyltransferase [Vicinamibacterales bacterium]|nr:class I SAM-dependent methyltransferase [Vicinamibacterales bacterium]
MFDASAEFYDLIYATIKDYPAEAGHIASLLRRLNPACRTVLDVACGTGEHARLLAHAGFIVDGVDLDAVFVRLARQKHPSGRFFEADMATFRLPHRYDAVTCLFGSIGYLRTLDRVGEALTSFRGHLAPGGVVVIEPWFAPGVLEHGRVAHNTGEVGGIRVTRHSRVDVAGRLSRLHFDYEIDDGSGTRRASEVHELGLFTTAELLEAFRRAGLEAHYDPKGFTDRGLYLARIAA